MADYADANPPYGCGEARYHSVIACDKREAFAQGSGSDEAIHRQQADRWIASLRSQ
jgi:hypothetical protein